MTRDYISGYLFARSIRALRQIQVSSAQASFRATERSIYAAPSLSFSVGAPKCSLAFPGEPSGCNEHELFEKQAEFPTKARGKKAPSADWMVYGDVAELGKRFGSPNTIARSHLVRFSSRSVSIEQLTYAAKSHQTESRESRAALIFSP